MEDISKKITEELVILLEENKEIRKSIKNISDLKEKINESLGLDMSSILKNVIGGGIVLEASDLHIEPEESLAKIRIRMDGVLHDVITIDTKTYEGILSRIKLLAQLKLNIADRPQDGRFSIRYKDSEEMLVEMRVSVIPAEYGESIVIRILNPKTLIGMEDLGLRDDLKEIFAKEIKKPNGMIIVTGPTGSGKTTTLYAFLKNIFNPEIKIITIEDPIEYHLKGISQTQVAPEKGYDFASGLKSIVRQDPDVILVGEIRDPDTADISLQAALTGHLVLTTLHTNDAAGTISRLTSLGAKLSVIAPAINMAIAQRLVRKICKECCQLETVSSEDLKKIKKALENIPKAIKVKINENMKIPHIHIKGCKKCNFTGYKGRVGVVEAILINQNMKKFILLNPSISDMQKEAVENGMITMYQDGLIKVIEGITTIDEIERVIGEID